MRIVIPYSMLASDNKRFGVVKGRMILTKKYRDSKEAAHLSAMAQARTARLRPIEGPVSVTGRVYWPDGVRRDMTMFIKGLHDALEGVAYLDDFQIRHLSYERMPDDADNPRVEIDIEPYTRS